MPRSLLLIALFVATAHAAPIEMTHQGRLLDASGLAVNGARQITLTLTPSNGGTPYVQEQTVQVQDGYYSVILGAGGGLDDALVDADALLSVAVDGVVLGAPSRLRAVPRAASAASADLRRVTLSADALVDGTTRSGLVQDGDALLLGGGGYGMGSTDLVVTPDMSPFELPSGTHYFRNITVQAGAVLTTTPFNGYEGGVLDLRATGTIQIDGTIDLGGLGYRGGKTVNINPTDQWQPVAMQTGQPGESATGYGNTLVPYEANGAGGGGGEVDNCSYAPGGGGGGHATPGTAAVNASVLSSGTCAIGLSLVGTSHAVNARSELARGGRGGTTYSAPNAHTLTMGGGGGASGSDADCAGRRGGHGGNGGGALGLAGTTVIVGGVLDVSGDRGGDSARRDVGPCTFSGNNGAGGGGAGGSVRINGQSVTLTGSVDARGGGSGTPIQSALVGGVGGSGWVSLTGASVSNGGTIQADTNAIVSESDQPAGDGLFGTWTSAPLDDVLGDSGQIEQVDLFLTADHGVHSEAWLCASDPEQAPTMPSDCTPVARSGAVLPSPSVPVQRYLHIQFSAKSDPDFRRPLAELSASPPLAFHGIQLSVRD